MKNTLREEIFEIIGKPAGVTVSNKGLIAMTTNSGKVDQILALFKESLPKKMKRHDEGCSPDDLCNCDYWGHNTAIDEITKLLDE